MGAPDAATPVLIAGGGPVGLTLALVLAHHQVASTVLERSEHSTQHPKMDLTNGRSMELFRSIGIADELRSIGVPEDQPLDVVWATSAAGHELHRQHYPSPAEQRERSRARNDGTDTTEPRLRVSQILVEPMLRRLAAAHPLIDLRIGWTATGVDDSGDQARIQASTPDGNQHVITAQLIAGCDGGASTIRGAVGIELEGDFSIFRVHTQHFRSTANDVLGRLGPYYHLQNDFGTLIAQDGRTTWTFHGALPRNTQLGDPAELLAQRLGVDVDVTPLMESTWTPHLAVATHYRAGRVFLAGDAAHIFVPTGGYGMNTGIADAFDLGWKMAATLNNWAGPGLLDSYELERRPIAVQNMHAAKHHSAVRATVHHAYSRARADGDLDGSDPAAKRRRAALGQEIAALYDGEYESWGVEFGYRYNSPVLCTEPDGPPFEPRRYRPTTAPGWRLPALHLDDGTALHDMIGPPMTLLARCGADPSTFRAAAAHLQVPLQVVELPDEPALSALERRLLLVRPDHHVAWRGDDVPSDPAAVIGCVTGK